jgi:hypothetical protein
VTPALAGPKVRIPLTCDQLAPSALLNSSLNTTMVPDDPFPDPDLTRYVAIQDGALDCFWSGSVVGGFPVANWQVLAIPDATTIWNKYLSQQEAPFPTSDFGPGVHGVCEAEASDPHDEGCNLDVLVGSVWLDIIGDTGAIPTTPTAAAVTAHFRPLLQNAITAVKGITAAEPAWTDPAATPTHLPPIEGVVVRSSFQTAIHNDFGDEVTQPDFDFADAQLAQMLPTGFREDAGGGLGPGDPQVAAKNFGATIEVLPSGTWAYPQMEATASSQPGFAELTGIGTKAYIYTGPGTSDAKVETIIVGTAGEHLYSLDFSDPGTAGTPDLVAMAKAAAGYVVKELTP